MVKIQWTDKISGSINDGEDALQMGQPGTATTVTYGSWRHPFVELERQRIRPNQLRTTGREAYQRRSATARMCST